MSKLTDSFQRVRVFNSHEFYRREPYMYYRPYERTGVAGWLVTKHGTTFPGHWADNGDKFFMSEGGRDGRAEALAKAQEWASKEFGVEGWARDPYGSYGPAEYVKARIAELKGLVKALDEAEGILATNHLKVYSWIGVAHRLGHGQYRLMVAARSFAAAQRAAVAHNLFKPSKDHTSVTANEVQLAVAAQQPGVVFGRPLNDHHGRYLPVPGR